MNPIIETCKVGDVEIKVETGRVAKQANSVLITLGETIVLVTAVAFTNQFHKWAHMPVVPRPVAFAQRHGLILTVGHHDQHHAAPHDRHHCITFGRMDRVLDLVTVPWSARRRATHPTAR